MIFPGGGISLGNAAKKHPVGRFYFEMYHNYTFGRFGQLRMMRPALRSIKMRQHPMFAAEVLNTQTQMIHREHAQCVHQFGWVDGFSVGMTDADKR